jgi:NitT/TauT family transport system ATP-binding protein
LGTTKAIRFKNASKFFGDKKIFGGFNLEIDTGSFVTLLGPSGGGKSTILRLIAGIEFVTDGALDVAREEASSLSYVFQDANLLSWKTLSENIRLPFEVGILKNKYSVTEIDAKVAEALQKVHLEGAGNLFPHELSGGMKMRVSLARAIVTSPKLLLMDEPFGALDEVTRFDMQNQLLELWQNEKMTIVFVTHSIFEAAYVSQKIVMLKRNGSASEITLDLPEYRDDSVRTSEQMIRTVQDLSQRFRA